MKITNFRGVLIKTGDLDQNGRVYTEESLRKLAEQDDSLVAQVTKYKITGETENTKAADEGRFEK